MKSTPQISDAEFEVMKIIWKYEPISTPDIVEKLSHENSWSPKTVHTLLLRLEKKGAVSHTKKGRMFVYESVIREEQYTAVETHAFLDKFYNGTFHHMVADLMEQDFFTAKDIRELRMILDKNSKSRKE
ncbi:MAG: BlaI/MecI/CopY family transcriptional regulator [Ruminococcus sp.]|jgi:BlaI family penicillinase repressor